MLPPPSAEKLQNFFGVFLQFQIGVDTQKPIIIVVYNREDPPENINRLDGAEPLG